MDPDRPHLGGAVIADETLAEDEELWQEDDGGDHPAPRHSR